MNPISGVLVLEQNVQVPVGAPHVQSSVGWVSLQLCSGHPTHAKSAISKTHWPSCAHGVSHLPDDPNLHGFRSLTRATQRAGPRRGKTVRTFLESLQKSVYTKTTSDPRPTMRKTERKLASCTDLRDERGERSGAPQAVMTMYAGCAQIAPCHALVFAEVGTMTRRITDRKIGRDSSEDENGNDDNDNAVFVAVVSETATP